MALKQNEHFQYIDKVDKLDKILVGKECIDQNKSPVDQCWELIYGWIKQGHISKKIFMCLVHYLEDIIKEGTYN